MSVFFPISEFFQNSGNQAAEFTENLRDGIATFACSLWQNFPDFFTEGTNPGSSFARGFMNQMCLQIQPPVPPPTPPFTGGQCMTLYDVTVRYFQSNLSTCVQFSFDAISLNVPGPIQGLELVVTEVIPPGGANIVGGIRYEVFVQGAPGTNPVFNSGWIDSDCPSETDRTFILSVARSDGQPDNCGDPPSRYNSPQPTINDLRTTININNPDGATNSYELVYNKITNQYNFPIGFKINGNNVILNFGGINFYGNPGITTPSGSNDVEPPGSDGGNNGVDGEYEEVFEENEYLTEPDLVNPETIEEIIEWVICDSGILETITETIKTIKGINPVLLIIIQILVNIVEEICNLEELDCNVGIPEYNILKPGIERPAIVYIYKEVINGKIQRPTYSSTVTNPSQAAINNIETISVPDKTIGTHLTTVILIDGSRVKATGNTPTASLTNFNFLLDQVDNQFKQSDINDRITTSTNTRLNVVTLKCRQIEYYPFGKNANVTPEIKRIIQIN